LNKTRLPLQDLNAKLAAIFAERVDREVFLRADKTVPYGFVVEVMSEIRKAGVDKLGMITEPPEGLK
jgi:biopolymer transport protein TolR